MALIGMGFARVVVGWLLLVAPLGVGGQRVTTLEHLLRGSGASAVLLDVGSGRIVDRTGDVALLAAPGSTLKPFFLLAALEAGTVREGTSVECRGDLKVGGRNLACTHPRGLTVFAAREALAYSCNTYFAQLARATPAGVLVRGVREFGVSFPGSGESPEARVLLTLGLGGVRVTPLQLARAYRMLAMRFAGVTDPHLPLGIVRNGLTDSVRFGMADNAAVSGMVIEGKTGTASDAGQAWTHGWFAGIVEGSPRRVLVVYVPRGSGADAAGLARTVLMGTRR